MIYARIARFPVTRRWSVAVTSANIEGQMVPGEPVSRVVALRLERDHMTELMHNYPHGYGCTSFWVYAGEEG